MKNFLKGTAIAALVMFIIGVGLTIMGGVMGGGLMNMSIENGRLRVRNVTIGLNGVNIDNDYTSEIFLDSDSEWVDADEEGEMNNNYTHKIDENITSLDFSLGAAEIFILPGDKFSVEVTENPEDYSIKVKNDRLIIRLKKNNFFHFNVDEKVYITYPKGTEFKEIDIDLGAGKLTAEDLIADELDIDVGAGQFIGTGFVCNNKADINSGASQVTIEGDFKGKTSLECGAGQITLELNEWPQEYGYDVEVGLGQVKLFDASFNGIHDSKSNVGTIPFFDIEAGVGQVVVK